MTEMKSKQWEEPLRWALESESNPALAAANWLARDIDPDCASAVELLANPKVPLSHLEQAKDVYKTMRIVGETSADRRMGARLYLSAIAAALALYDRRITTQSDAAMLRALRTMLDDVEVPEALRAIAGQALAVIEEQIAQTKLEETGFDDDGAAT